MTELESKIIMELALVADEANKKVCKIADKYGIDRNVAIKVFMNSYQGANKDFDFSDIDVD